MGLASGTGAPGIVEINGQTGPEVTLDAADVGALPSDHQSWVAMNQAAYDALDPPDPAVLYIIVAA